MKENTTENKNNYTGNSELCQYYVRIFRDNLEKM